MVKKVEELDQINHCTLLPSCDVVRVNPSGDSVLAGRGSPNALITVNAGKKSIGSERADSRREWVLIPEVPLGLWSDELRLEQETEKVSRILEGRSVLVYLPEGGKRVGFKISGETVLFWPFRSLKMG